MPASTPPLRTLPARPTRIPPEVASSTTFPAGGPRRARLAGSPAARRRARRAPEGAPGVHAAVVQRAALALLQVLLVPLAGLSGCEAYDAGLLASRGDAVDMRDAGGAGAKDASAPRDGGDLGCASNDEFATCSRPHAETICAGGACFVVGCNAPHADCDGDPDNGCEVRLDSAEHCGLCRAACLLTGGEAACVAGQCVLVRCEDAFGDCDGNPDNGCETRLDSTQHCGGCDAACSAPDNAVAACTPLGCGFEGCTASFGDCNGDPQDGCETKLDDALHCGACAVACTPPNASGDCASGQCVIAACDPGFVDCNGLVGDGCEARLDSLAHCGACGESCALPNVAQQACTVAPAATRCTVDHGCPAAGASCIEGAPENGCEPGFGDCDGLDGNGCETDLQRLRDCGACGNSCVTPNTITACVAGACHDLGCVPGHDRCQPQAACSSLASDPSHCGECERACDGVASNCAGGVCTSQACPAGSADCDGMSSNGCEVNLSSASSCGVCGHSCGPYPHATAACLAGACAIGACAAGFADCDGDVSNGCEVDTRTPSDCGACGESCARPNATTSCESGSCELVSCLPGRGNCNQDDSDGCEANLGLPEQCRSCGNDCTRLPHVLSSGCGPNGCEYVCVDGRADCDGQRANGCEAALDSAQSCGACGKDCSALPHVSSASCGQGGTCTNLVCDSGFADCNENPADGCERSLRTASDCGACGQACAPAHTSATCALGVCQIISCDNGFANCNGNLGDGCEAALSSPEHCGSCTTQCSGSSSCNNGRCACTQDSDCTGGLTCCSGTCTDTGGVCFPWPCLPGTARTNNASCGGCGQVCGLFCCSG